jgi:peptidoglycan/xylan/chitin deacetylase (PgdA/CDA1 family)
MNPWFIGVPAAIAGAAGLTAYAGINPRSQIFGRTTYRTNSPRKLAITFDDGPNPSITPKLLDLLDKHKTKATFFVIGAYAREFPELVREAKARGHVVGNHTETHPRLFWRNSSDIRVELRLCQSAVKNAAGAPPKWFRPPFGWRNPWVAMAARELDLRTAMWTLMPGDWKAPSAQWLIERIEPIAKRARRSAQKASGSGDILCLHDGSHRQQNADRSHTLAALEHWLPRWRDLGLEFVTIQDAAAAPAA